MRRLFTVGYEQASSQAVLDELKRAGVTLVVDTHPASVRYSELSDTRFKNFWRD